MSEGNRSPDGAFTAFEADVIATMRCNCEPNNPPMFFRSHLTVLQCMKCGASFRIRSVAYDATVPQNGRTDMPRPPAASIICVSPGRHTIVPATQLPPNVSPFGKH